MATLANEDFTNIRQYIAHDTAAKDEFKSWGINKATWKALFQAAEDWFVDGFTTTPTSSFKAALEAEAGAMTNAQAKQIGFIWMHWRFVMNPA